MSPHANGIWHQRGVADPSARFCCCPRNHAQGCVHHWAYSDQLLREHPLPARGRVWARRGRCPCRCALTRRIGPSFLPAIRGHVRAWSNSPLARSSCVGELIDIEIVMERMVARNPDAPNARLAAMRHHMEAHHLTAEQLGEMARQTGVEHVVAVHIGFDSLNAEAKPAYTAKIASRYCGACHDCRRLGPLLSGWRAFFWWYRAVSACEGYATRSTFKGHGRGKETMSERTGQCSCGGTRYKLTKDPMFTHVCHCSQCKRQTGTAFVTHVFIETAHFEPISGKIERVDGPSTTGGGHQLFPLLDLSVSALQPVRRERKTFPCKGRNAR